MFSKFAFRAAAVVVAAAFTLSIASHAEVNAGSKSARPLITGKIDDAQRVSLQGNVRPEARIAGYDRGAVDPGFALHGMQLLLKRSPEQEAALAILMDKLHTPGNPLFHKWLSENEWRESFGVNRGDVQKVTGWLQSHGFSVDKVQDDGIVITFSGTAGQVEEAFHTPIHNVVDRSGDKHFANVKEPQIPAAFANVMVGPTALHNFFPHSMIKKLNNIRIDDKHKIHKATKDAKGNYTYSGCTNIDGSVDENCYAVTAQDQEVIYNTKPLYTASTPLTGAGQTIGLVEDEDYYLASDWSTYVSTFGLTSYGGTLSANHPNCTDPGDLDDGTDLEVELDIEMATAMAPGAAVQTEVCGDTSTVFGGLIAVQNLASAPSITVPVLSISYGECESATGAAGNASFTAAYQQAAARGMSIFVSSGDEDAFSCDADQEYAVNGLTVSGWGDSAYNVSVGGTDFGDTYSGTSATYWNTTNSAAYESAKSYIPEIPWNDSCASQLIATTLFNLGDVSTANTYGADSVCGQGEGWSVAGGSGGASNCYSGASADPYVANGTCAGLPKPSWQSVYGNPADGVRDIPDVSLFAANGIWNHYIIICYSDAAGDGVPCTGAPSGWVGVGGTSASSPMMAGIQALINEKTGEMQGNPNYILYKLASTEYGSSGSTACNSSNGTSGTSGCVFYDQTLGDNNADCYYYSTSPLVAYNCYAPSNGNYVGVGSLTDSAYSPTYATTKGWDFATGIGSVNAANLVTAWAAYSNSAPTVTATTSPSSVAVGQVVTWTATVTGNGSYPTGSVAFSVSGTSGTVATVALPAASPAAGPCTTTCASTVSYAYTIPNGTAAGPYTVTATYTVANEQYPSGASGTGIYNVVANVTTSALTANPTTFAFGSHTVLTDVISWPTTTAINPTGNVVLSSSLSQEGTFETVPLTSCTTNLSAKTATCSYNWTPTYGGAQTITAAYSGDTNYAASSATAAITVTQASTSTTLSINPSVVSSVQLGSTYTAVITYTASSAPTSGTLYLTSTPTGGPAQSVNISTCTTTTATKTIKCTIADPNAWDEYENGTYSVTATYSGDPGDAGSTSTGQTFIVSNSDTSTVTFTLATTSSTYATGGTSVATIKVKGTTGDGTPTGTIAVTGTGTLGTLTTITLPGSCTLSGVTYTCMPTLTIPAGTAAGAYTLTASYSGDANYIASSKTATYTINKATPTAAASDASGGFESTVVLSATDTGVTSGVAPTGTVTFKVNGTTVTGTPSCSGAGLVETCTESYTLPATLLAGQTYPITAVFATDTNYLASNTATATLTVTASTASFGTMSFSPAASEPQGTSQAITISDTLTFSGTAPSGAVTYVLNGVTYTAACGSTSPATCTATVPAATIAALAVNTYTVTAALAAGGGYSATAGTSGTFTITAAAANTITFSSVSHNFGQVAVGTAAVAYTLKVTNTSTTTAYPFSLVFTPANGFTTANSCGTSIAAGANCELAFYFTPTATGAVSATWSLASENGFSYAPSNGGLLQGSGTSQGGVSLTTNGHNFGTVTVGQTSPTYGTELSNSTTSAETISLGTVSAPFSMLTNCGTTLAAGASCEIEYTFTPTSTSTVKVTVPLSGSPTAITSGGVALPNGGITLSGN